MNQIRGGYSPESGRSRCSGRVGGVKNIDAMGLDVLALGLAPIMNLH